MGYLWSHTMNSRYLPHSQPSSQLAELSAYLRCSQQNCIVSPELVSHIPCSFSWDLQKKMPVTFSVQFHKLVLTEPYNICIKSISTRKLVFANFSVLKVCIQINDHGTCVVFIALQTNGKSTEKLPLYVSFE